MIRKFKALGLALVAVFAMSALAATGASAASFNSEANTTIVTGDDDNSTHTFAAGGVAVECTESTFTGTQSGTASATLSVRPIYNGCTFLGEPATVHTTGCTYEFSAVTNATGHLPAKIECTGSNMIKVTTSACSLTFNTTDTDRGVTATNLGSGKTADVTIHATADAEFTKSGPLCFLVVGNKGTYTGTSTLKGYTDTAIHGDLHGSFTVTEGAQVGISWK